MNDSKTFEEYAELVSRFKAGDESAYEQIYIKSQRLVYAICYGILNNQEDAFDAMQDTYISVYRNINELENNNTFLSWLKTIANNKAFDISKRKKITVSYDDAIAADDTLQFDDNLEDLPDYYIMDKTKREALLKIIRDELSEDQYQTIHMFYFSELSVEDIAEIMGCPPGTVKSRLSTSRSKIKKGIRKYERDNKDVFAATSAPAVPFLTRFFQACSEDLTVPPLDITSLLEKAPVKDVSSMAAGKGSVDGAGAKAGFLATNEGKIITGVLAAAILLGGAFAVKKIFDRSGSSVETVTETVAVEQTTVVETVEETSAVETSETAVESEPGSYTREGDYVFFGQYEQSGGMNNGPEPIEWEILDESDGHLVLISRYVLDCRSYFNAESGSTWEDSALREWLNNDFYNTAFDADQQSRIILSDVVNSGNAYSGSDGGNDTQDYVYILSVDEILDYYDFECWYDNYNYGFCSALITEPTSYASSHRGLAPYYDNAPAEATPTLTIDQSFYDDMLAPAGLPSDVIGMVSSTYWVRTPAVGIASQDVCVVTAGGCVGWDNALSDWYCSDDITNVYCGVRPVICIEE